MTKELFELIVLCQETDGILLYSKAFSWETDLLAIIGDFEVRNEKKKKCKHGKRYHSVINRKSIQ